MSKHRRKHEDIYIYIYACRCFEAIARARVLVLGDKWCRLATPKNTSLQVNVPGDGTEHSRSKVREHTTCPKASSMTIACARIAFRQRRRTSTGWSAAPPPYSHVHALYSPHCTTGPANFLRPTPRSTTGTCWLLESSSLQVGVW